MVAPKFSCVVESGDLLSALKSVCRVVQTRNVIPILSHAWLRFDGKSLLVTATNLDQAMTVEVVAQGAGSITVSAQRLLAFAMGLPRGSECSMAARGGMLEATCGNTRHRLPTLPSEDFPVSVCDGIENGHSWKVPGGRMAEMLAATFGACEKNNYTRAYLMGVGVNFGRLASLCGTNTHYLAEEIAPEFSGADDGSFIIPLAAVAAAIEISRADIVTVRFSGAKNAFSVGGGNAVLRSKVIDGTFPDYKRIIPADGKTFVSVSRAAFIETLHRGAYVPDVLGAGETAIDGVLIHAVDGRLSIYAQGDNGERSEDSCECEIKGGAAKFAASFAYLKAAASSFGECDNIEISFNSDSLPLRLRRAGDADSTRVIVTRRVKFSATAAEAV